MTGPWALPEGWCWRTFKEVATVASNLVDPADYPNHLHLAPNHVLPETGRHEELVTVAADGVTSSKHLYKPGQIIYSKIRPYLRKAAIAKTEGLCSADMYPIETELESRFLMWWMLSGEFTKLALKGRSVIPKINQRELDALPVPVPPLADQQAVVETIERMLSHLDVASRELHSGSQRMAVLERSLLNAASRGSLIAGRTRGAFEPVPLAEVAETALGKMLSSKVRAGANALPYLRGANVAWGHFDLSEIKTMSIEEDELTRFAVEPGDLLVVEGAGSPSEVGRAAIWRGEVEPILYQKALHRVRPSTRVTAEWLELVLHDLVKSNRHLPYLTGTTIRHLPQQKLRQIPVPLPPLDVQRVLVAEYRLLRSRAHRMSGVLTASAARSGPLRRSILKAAFEGRLTGITAAASADDLQEDVA